MKFLCEKCLAQCSGKIRCLPNSLGRYCEACYQELTKVSVKLYWEGNATLVCDGDSFLRLVEKMTTSDVEQLSDLCIQELSKRRST